MYKRIIKRIIDVVLSLFALIILSPLFLILAILIYRDLGSIFFKQKRIGKGERVIELLKFKSMKDVDESKGLVSNEDRVTKLGRFIRNYSLDELPSLINILKGDLSVVGPRPLLVTYLPYYKQRHKARHSVKPGLTGLAQINGRNQTTWNKRLDYDIEYVNNQSFTLDMQIIFKTFFKVIKKEGVESDVDMSIINLTKDKDYKESN